MVKWSDRTVALQQFRDNLAVAAKGHGAPQAMAQVCDVIKEIWNLKVVCSAKNSDACCCGTCMRSSLTTMGVLISLGAWDTAVFCTSQCLGSSLVAQAWSPLAGFLGSYN